MSKGIARIVLKEGYKGEKSGLKRLNQLEKLIIKGEFFYTKIIKSISELEEPFPSWGNNEDSYIEIKWSS